MSEPQAAIVITTRNRCEDLRRALQSCVVQTARPEIVVCDDGSTDGTAEMVRREFPQVRLERVEQSIGYIAQRNRAAVMLSTPIVFSLDDDAVYTSPAVVAQTLADFDDPRIGAVAIPFINVRQDARLRQTPPDTVGCYATFGYIGTAHAVRRELFLSLGGYRQFLRSLNEESDYAIRLLNSGHVVRLGRADPIHHFESLAGPTRPYSFYGPRNHILYVWHNVPFPAMLVDLIGTTWNNLAWGYKQGRFGRAVWAVLSGYGAIFKQLSCRRPVPYSVYRISRELRRRGHMGLSEFCDQLPPPTVPCEPPPELSIAKPRLVGHDDKFG